MLPINHLAVFMMLAFALILGLSLLGLSALLGRIKPDPRKLSTYECGVPPSGSPRNRFSVKFYLIAIFFLIFDIEIAFLFPWALIVKSQIPLGPLVIGEMFLFIALLGVGYFYIWKKGALEWD
ncbi:MAG: NADH-quinone oxidoreductase subunit A [Deltaproteobacteria bacterium]|nr:NADH-quinone oxidoreductase subunit A [Deltaproteobacteria bacterium]